LKVAAPEDDEEEKSVKKEEQQQRLIFPRDTEGYAILPSGEGLSRKAQMSMIRDYCTINYRKLDFLFRDLYNIVSPCI
jgi:hypothetical protein